MRRLPLVLALAFCALFLAAPLLAMAVATVVGADGFTLAAWSHVLADPIDRTQLLSSLELGCAATAIAFVFGCGHAFTTFRTDVFGSRVLGPLGVAPLVVPPILVAMGFADFADVAGFWPCAFLLGVSYAPFVAVLATRGLRGVDGRNFEAAWLARGRWRAELLLFRMALPEILAGCLFAFLFVISEHGVPEFLTVKGKTWHTYAEGVFARWTRRATGTTHEDLVSPIVAAAPLIAVIAVALFLALRLRAHSGLRSEAQPLPLRPFGCLRAPALLLPLTWLGCGIGIPVFVMGRWAAGSTHVDRPMALAHVRHNVRAAMEQAGGDLLTTIQSAAIAGGLAILVAIPIALAATRRWPALQYVAILPLGVPAILLGMGLVHVFNSRFLGSNVYPWSGDFYDSSGLLVCGLAARFLPFGVLTLTQSLRRQPRSIADAAQLCTRGPVARFCRIQLPLLVPAAWSATCLVFVLGLRELDLAVLLPAGNDTIVRRLSNIVHFGGEDVGGSLALLLLLTATAVPLISVLVTGRKLEALS